MANPYKLKQEIKQFIISEKKRNPELSCRALIPLIRENFQVSLSKSLINNVIKQNNLSLPAGRRRVRKEIILKQPPDIRLVRKERGFIENGGFFFLKIADFKLDLTSILAHNLTAYFSNLPEQDLQAIIEASIFKDLFDNKKSLWLFIGREMQPFIIGQYSQQLTEIPPSELIRVITEVGIGYNPNEINELHKLCLLQLNSYVQANFFPSAYQFLDFPAMQERFYHLWANIKRGEGILEIQFFCPEEFSWKNDIVWQEDLAYAIDRVNTARIFTQKKELILINSNLEIYPKI